MDSKSIEAKAAETFRRLGPAGWLAVAATTMPLLGLVSIVVFLDDLAPWLAAQEMRGVAIYIAGFTILSGIAILPTHASAIVGGWAFKFSIGFPAAMVGFFGGALVGFAIARYFSGDRALRVIDEHPKWRAVYAALLGSGFWRTLFIITLLRLPPNSPFALTNMVLAATRVPLLAYLIGTILGMMPRIALIVYLAAHASKLDFSVGKSWWIMGGGIVTLLIVFGIIGLIARRAIERVSAPHANTSV